MEPASSHLTEPAPAGDAQNAFLPSYGSCSTSKEDEEEEEEMLDWESNGTVWNLVIDGFSEAWSKVFLLMTLITSLVAGEESFMKCNQEDTPALRHYGEVLLCHYTKSYIFSFPAMATAVLLLLFGRDLLQKRFYYGLLKAGGVISFSDNIAWKDPFFMAMCWDFAHCIGYTIFHLIILSRAGKEMQEMKGFVPEARGTSAMPTDGGGSTTVVTTLTTTLAVTGAMMLLKGPKGGFKPKPVARGGRGAAGGVGTAMMLQRYIQTMMVLVGTFLESLLLIIFMYFAYDITGSLVSMSEYLESYSDLKGNQMMRLHTFRDKVAKRILEESPAMISIADGHINRVYERIVEKYEQEHACVQREHSQHSLGFPEDPSLDPEPLVSRIHSAGPRIALPGVIPGEFKTISLHRSLWPAELLMRRDIRGNDPKTFRRVWLFYSVGAACWLFHVAVVLIMAACREFMLVFNKEYESLIPFTIMLVHAAGNLLTIYVFCESLAPFGFTQQLMGSGKSQ